ncbi:MAG: SbcC/MukB-like Walker B domain-containing protein [Candidatus Xenobiia bacterium LiM19]
MKPRMLKLRGLHSYSEEAVIDFEKLGESNLFGIFGPTGSGKSTILDAITLALYGHVERLGKKGYHGLISDHCTEASVEFMFSIGRGEEEQLFTIGRAYIKEKDCGSEEMPAVKFKRGSLRSLKGKEHTILANKTDDMTRNIEEIIGLSFDDFTRAVVLPQGRFAEFLKLKGGERIKMLERIFSLQRYGEALNKRLGEEKNRIETALESLTGKQSGLNITREKLDELERANEQATVARERKTSEYEKMRLHFQGVQRLWELQKRLCAEEQKEQQLLQREGQIAEQERRLERAQKAEALRPDIVELERLRREEADKKQTALTMKDALQDAEAVVKKAQSEEDAAQAVRDREEPGVIALLSHRDEAFRLRKSIDEKKKAEKAAEQELAEAARGKEKVERDLRALSEELQRMEDDHQKRRESLEILRVPLEDRRHLDLLIPIVEKMAHHASETEKKEKDLQAKGKELPALLHALTERKRRVGEAEESLKNDRAKLEELKKAPPCREEDIRSTMLEIQNLRTVKTELLEGERMLSQCAKDIDQLEISQADSSKNLLKEREQLTTNQASLLQIRDQLREARAREKEAMTANAAALISESLKDGKPCPVCGSCDHPAPAPHEQTDILRIRQEISDLETREREINTAVNSCALQVQLLESSLEQGKTHHSELGKQKEEMISRNSSQREKLPEAYRSESTAELDRIFHTIEDSCSKASLSLEEWKKTCETDEENLDKLRVNLEKEKSALNKGQLEHNACESAINTMKDNLSGAVATAAKLKEDLDAARGAVPADEIVSRKKEIDERDRQHEVLSSELKRHETAISLQKSELQNAGERRNILEKKQSEAAKELAILAASLQNDSGLLRAITAEEDIEAFFASLEARQRQIFTSLKEAKRTNEKAKDEFKEALLEEGKARTRAEAAEQQFREKGAQLQIAADKAGFATVGEAEDSLPPDSVWIAGTEAVIKEYRDSLRACREDSDKLKMEIDGKSVDEAAFLAEEQEVNRLKTEYEDANVALGTTKNAFEDGQKRFEQWKRIEQERQVVQKQHDCCTQLDSVLRGKAFVEFMAEEQLKLIAREASEKLGMLTRRRYALEISSEGSFIIRDDALGGSRRPSSSLSGGETFIVSLALALSLSSHIQLKGRYLLEFFFLDEGFGSLDPLLLDTVMSSLERLKAENFTLGIISHVPELRQRIGSRLIIKNDEPGLRGSTVSHEAG